MKYELFEILSNMRKLRDFRKENVGDVVYKVTTNNPNWFYYGDGLYDADLLLDSSSFEFELTPLKRSFSFLSFFNSKYNYIIKDFIEHGATDSDNIRAIMYDGEKRFIYFNSLGIFKSNRNYFYSPVLEINEDIYNLCMIQARRFSAVTKDDLSEYSSYFRVSEEPYKLVSDESMLELYKNGSISFEEYKKMRESYEREVQLVRTLRK